MSKTIRTYNARLRLSVEGQVIVESVGDYLGHIRNVDLRTALDLHSRGIELNNQERMDLLLERYPGLEYEYGKTIIMRNNEQVALSARTHADNVVEWRKDLTASLGKKKQSRRTHNRQEYLRKRINGGLSVCIGGKKLYKKVVKGEEGALQLWKARRRFLDCNGRTGRPYGNDCIRVMGNGDIVVYVPRNLWEQFNIDHTKSARVVVGNAKFRYGWDAIQDRITNKRAVAAAIETTSNGKLQLRVTVPYEQEEQVDKPIVPHLNRFVGVDVNDGHFDATILDYHGNKVGQSITIDYDPKNVQAALTELLEWGDTHNVSYWFLEELKGIQRRITRKNNKAGALNRTISNLPTGQVKKFMSEQCSRRGLPIKFVSPYMTSKNAPQWAHLFPTNTTTHHIASYLIGRKGLGLSIRNGVMSRSGSRIRESLNPMGVTCHSDLRVPSSDNPSLNPPKPKSAVGVNGGST